MMYTNIHTCIIYTNINNILILGPIGCIKRVPKQVSQALSDGVLLDLEASAQVHRGSR